jgi:hypothetical protein
MRTLTTVTLLILLYGYASAQDREITEHHMKCDSIPGMKSGFVKYKVAIRDHAAVGAPPPLYLYVSITPERASSEANLVRLGCELAADFPKEAAINALILDDEEAARRLALYAEDQHGHWLYLWHLRARYQLNRREKTQFVEFVIPIVQDGLLATKRFKTSIEF